MNATEYENWKNHPLTKSFHKFLKDYRKSLMEQWAEGTFTHPDATTSALMNAEAIARCQIYQDLVDLEPNFISDFYKVKE